jgi:hypothetical protein
MDVNERDPDEQETTEPTEDGGEGDTEAGDDTE